MGIAEKKAMREATEVLAKAKGTLCTKSGLDLNAEIDFSTIESDESTLKASSNVPVAILSYITTLTQDSDYKEAFGAVKTIKFVPAKEEGIDYEKSAKLDGGSMSISYLPKNYMNGGYERSIKRLF